MSVPIPRPAAAMPAAAAPPAATPTDANADARAANTGTAAPAAMTRPPAMPANFPTVPTTDSIDEPNEPRTEPSPPRTFPNPPNALDASAAARAPSPRVSMLMWVVRSRVSSARRAAIVPSSRVSRTVSGLVSRNSRCRFSSSAVISAAIAPRSKSNPTDTVRSCNNAAICVANCASLATSIAARNGLASRNRCASRKDARTSFSNEPACNTRRTVKTRSSLSRSRLIAITVVRTCCRIRSN